MNKKFITYDFHTKKGMLLVSETLKMVIAVIAIGFLIYLLAMMYYSGGAEKEKQDATKMISRVEGIVMSIEEGNYTEINSLTPGGWSIFSYTGSEQRPNDCINQNCVCICDDITIKLFNGQLKECNKNGICFISEDLYPNSKIKIEEDGSSNLEVYHIGGRIGVRKI